VVRPEEMIVVDMDGHMVDGPKGAAQCYVVKMHSCLYRERLAVQSITHTHPRFTNVMALLKARLKPMSNEGHQLVRRDIPVFPHSRLILSEEDGMQVVRAMGKSPALILRGHGAVTTGNSLEQSVMAMLHLEEQARLNWYAYCAVGRDYDGIPDADMDRRWIDLALDELLDNAVKFSPDGGRVVVSAEAAGTGALRLTVADQGWGMPPEQAGDAFREFVQGDPSDTRQFGGLGLGLPLVQRVAEAHGGSVELASEEGRGTRVSVILPTGRSARSGRRPARA